MPHLSVYALESDLTGREAALIAELTEAVVASYGEWAREIAVVQLIGMPPGRWGIGGVPAEAPAPRVTFGIRAEALRRPDTDEIVATLTAGVKAAIARVLGDRPGTAVDFVGAVSAPGNPPSAPRGTRPRNPTGLLARPDTPASGTRQQW